MTSRPGWLFALTSVLILAAPTRSGAQATGQDREDTKSVKAMVEEAVGWYRLYSDANAAEPMAPRPVLRWHNATRGQQESEGMFVLWVNNLGRPEASVSIYTWNGYITLEFVSLSPEAKLVAREGQSVVWHPRKGGVEYKDIPGAPAPADTPAARLRQMRALTERFHVTMGGVKADESDQEEMRVLPKPLYRQEASGAPGAETGLFDHAVFAFVQGTDPEAVLLLQAVRDNGQARWRYAFGRATGAGLRARLDKAVVWTVPHDGSVGTPLMTQIVFSRPQAVAGGAR